MTNESWDWDEQVAGLRADGAKEFSPNGLRITCIRADGTLLEHEHADHPTYMFPVTVDYVGTDPKFRAFRDGLGNEGFFEGAELEGMKHEIHAVIYIDGDIAVTLYECCFYLWKLNTGKCAAGPSWYPQKEWLMNQEGIDRCLKAFGEKKNG
jgi:hypothetical protein